jgi:hypothetical protein
MRSASEEVSPLLAYASSLLSTLKSALTAERDSHTKTRGVLLETQAKLAFREAELEACVPHIHHHLPTSPVSTLPQDSATEDPKMTPINRQEALHFLGLSSSHNRTLEEEIDRLAYRVSSRVIC